MKIIPIKCLLNFKARHTSFVVWHPGWTMPPFLPTYLKLSRYSWILVYAVKSFFWIIQGAHSWTVCDYCSVVWAHFGCRAFWDNIGRRSIVDLFWFISHSVSAGWQFLCCTVVRLAQHFSLIFQEEGTTGPKQPQLVSPNLLLAGCRRQTAGAVSARAGQRGVKVNLLLLSLASPQESDSTYL